MTLLLDETNPTTDTHAGPMGEAPIHQTGPFASEPKRRNRWLIGTGVLFALLAVVIAAVSIPHLDEGTGDRSYSPTSFAEVESEYSFGIGSLDIDLRNVDFPPGVHVIEVDHGIGAARVWLPADVNYQVAGDLNAGELDLFGETNDFFDTDLDARADVEAAATVIVDLEVSIGYGSVRQG